MTSEAQRRASKKYNQEKTTHFAIRLNNRTDADLIAKLTRQQSKQGYIKRLIREDIEREQAQ